MNEFVELKPTHPSMLRIALYFEYIYTVNNPKRTMALYGIWGSHTTESCPLNNANNRRAVLEVPSDLENVAKNYKINKIVGQYHSALEHTFLWVVDAEDPHLIERFCIEGGIAKFNAVKIVPLITFRDVVDKCKKVENG